MATLTGAVKVFIIQRLACFERPVDVQKECQAQFGVKPSLQQLASYNGDNPSSERMSKDLKDLFAETRKKFLSDTSSIPIASKAYRLRELQKLLDNNRDKSPIVAAQMLEQAAKEQGNAFTNKHELTGAGGAPLLVMRDWTGRKKDDDGNFVETEEA